MRKVPLIMEMNFFCIAFVFLQSTTQRIGSLETFICVSKKQLYSYRKAAGTFSMTCKGAEGAL